jgi:hypothetical protein
MDNTSNQKFEVFSITGTLIEITKDSEMIVSGHGGGGRTYTLPSGHVQGYTSDISIESETLTKTTIWLKTDDSREIDFTFSGEIKARQGHKISLLCVKNIKTDSIVIHKLINHTTTSEKIFQSSNMIPHYFGYGETPIRKKFKIGIVKYLFAALLGSLFGGSSDANIRTLIFIITWTAIFSSPIFIYDIIRYLKWKKKDQILGSVHN